jgi:hypothetical protein
MRRRTAVPAIVAGGAIAGSFDITYAIVFSGIRGVPAIRVLQSVAGGLLGQAAYEGGLGTAALGLLLHFSIAFTWAAIFYASSRRIPAMTRQPGASGPLFGIGIYLVMYFVVIPLSAYPRKVTYTPFLVGINLFVHMFLIGLPIALAARWAETSAARGTSEVK